MTDIAVVIMSFSRPHYLSQTVRSLENNVGKGDYDFIFLQDGPVNKYSGNRLADDENIAECISIAEQSRLPNKKFIVNSHNLGIGLQRNKVFNLFDEGYDLLFQIEDDIILGGYALKLLESMCRQFGPKAVCSAHRNKRFSEIDNYEDKLDKVIITDQAYWFIAGMWEQTYRTIEDRWKNYVDIIEGYQYINRPREPIFDQYDVDNAASDAVAGQILRENEIWRVVPVVSRSTYIGEQGVHFTPDSYAEKPTGEEGPTEFEQDPYIFNVGDTDPWEILKREAY